VSLARHIFPNVAKVDHTFVMELAPEQAQAMFLEEIAPELHRKAELAMCRDEPGHVLFNDGIVDTNDLPVTRSADAELYSALREVSGHHLHVDFEPEAPARRCGFMDTWNASCETRSTCSVSQGGGLKSASFTTSSSASHWRLSRSGIGRLCVTPVHV
jgi:hypothetical protein